MSLFYNKMEALEVKVSKLKQQLVEAEQELQYYRNLHISHLQSTCDHSDVVVHEHYNYHRDEYSYTTKCKLCQKILPTSPTLSTSDFIPA